MSNAGRTLGMLAAVTLVAAGGAPAQGNGGAMAAGKMDAVEYTVVFKSRWTAARHPFEYPEAGLVSGPHFSGLIGATHNTSWSLFREGAMPSAGIERLSEEGKHSPLDGAIRDAIAAGNAGSLVTTGPLRDFADSIVVTVTVDAKYPMLSLVAMIAPSPDWFTGIASINLMENGGWVASRAIDLAAYDSGGDDGTTYKAADKDNIPKKPVSRATTRHFAPNGTAVPVASVTITRK